MAKSPISGAINGVVGALKRVAAAMKRRPVSDHKADATTLPRKQFGTRSNPKS